MFHSQEWKKVKLLFQPFITNLGATYIGRNPLFVQFLNTPGAMDWFIKKQNSSTYMHVTIALWVAMVFLNLISMKGKYEDNTCIRLVSQQHSTHLVPSKILKSDWFGDLITSSAQELYIYRWFLIGWLPKLICDRFTAVIGMLKWVRQASIHRNLWKMNMTKP